MPYVLAGFLIFWLVLYAMRAFARASPVMLARMLKRGGGYLALLLALLVLFGGRIDFALVLAVLGFWLIGISRRSAKPLFGRGRAARQRAAGVSRVRSAMIEMELDHATGQMRGTILAGSEEGKSLDQMIRPQCEALYRLCVRDDPEGARLLEVYLDRRFPGWRMAGNTDYDARAFDAGGAARHGAMSEDEAYEVLGLHKGATRDDVMRSHRSLIKKLHPDHGGSTDLAARVNEAKDVLMRRHH
jgi:DnaJ domain